ncbi:hypothetical protein AL497_25730 [Klebsiella aerogenes]|nr:hypothetical protein AM336_14445 [Klebsiella aerogenes]AUY89104.1 hypothetical protein AL497_25730 [Klebsiella aerogenes]AUZ16945.1 hypothetical protein AL511_26175 [Klebsiella aerogenes]AVF01443.1 hypothetical protein AM441_23700 [Klebsiella aerogenes]AXY29637.1 hypothetical protein CEQ05_15550 [Klebsiella aerogenes]
MHIGNRKFNWRQFLIGILLYKFSGNFLARIFEVNKKATKLLLSGQVKD